VRLSEHQHHDDDANHHDHVHDSDDHVDGMQSFLRS
jgi:hypothetical protein